MGVREKIEAALREAMPVHVLELDENEGISGYVVSPRFEEMTSLQRQRLIDAILATSVYGFSRAERREVLMIAAITPAEFGTIDNQVLIEHIWEVDPGQFKIVVEGGVPEASYVRDVLDDLTGVATTEPQPVPEAAHLQTSFLAKRLANPQLTREKIQAHLDKNGQIGLISRQ